MKKCAVISLIFLLAASVAFADITISGIIGSGARVLEGSTASGSELQASGLLWGRLQMDAVNGANTLGGLLRLQTGFDTRDNPYSPEVWQNPNSWQTRNPYGYVWWQPIEQLKLQVGFIDAFATNYIVGWEFNENDAEDFIALAGYDYTGDIFNPDQGRSTGFYNGAYWTGAAVCIYPFSGLAINLAIPYTQGNGKTAKDVYQVMHGQIVYTIPGGIGRLSLTVTGGQDGYVTPLNIGNPLTLYGGWNVDVEANVPTFYGAFYMSALEKYGINMNFGFAYTVPATATGVSYWPGGAINDPAFSVNYNMPMELGFGISYQLEKFSVKARFASTFGGSVKTDNVERVYEPLKLGFGLMPSYDFGICRLYLNTGLSYKADEYTIDGNTDAVILKKGSSAYAWHIQPYVTKTIGGTTLYGGFYLETDTIDNIANGSKVLKWGIPVAVEYEF